MCKAGGKAAFARVIHASLGSLAPRQGFCTNFLKKFLYEHIAWKKDEIVKSIKTFKKLICPLRESHSLLIFWAMRVKILILHIGSMKFRCLNLILFRFVVILKGGLQSCDFVYGLRYFFAIRIPRIYVIVYSNYSENKIYTFTGH